MTAKLSDPITLAEPIRRGDETIASVCLRKPDVGALRGMKMVELMRMDVASYCQLLPRITVPSLLPDEIEALDVADLVSLIKETSVFFISRAEMEAIQAAGG